MPMRLSIPLAPALLAAATLAAMMLGAAPAGYAADLDYGFGSAPPPITESKVEFGSGWYVRGDIGATAIPAVSAVAPTIPSVSSDIFIDNSPSIVLRDSHQLGYTASIGAGYSFNRWLRADGVFDFHQPISSNFNGSPFNCPNGYGEIPATTSTNAAGVVTVIAPATAYLTEGTCTGTYRASLSNYDVLVNGYVDLGHWYGFTPYVGAGLGLSFGHYSTFSTYKQADNSSYSIIITNPITSVANHIDFDRSSGGNYANFAFALMAGVAYDIYPHTKIDIGYRYLHLGSVLGQELVTQEARVGLRYMVDN